MNIQLWGGPHDGQVMNVPEHCTRIRLPLSLRPVISSEDAMTPLTMNYRVAVYERETSQQGYIRYRYKGQEPFN